MWVQVRKNMGRQMRRKCSEEVVLGLQALYDIVMIYVPCMINCNVSTGWGRLRLPEEAATTSACWIWMELRAQ